MKYVTQEMLDRIGTKSEQTTAAEPIGLDSVRRFVQATMESNPIHLDEEAARSSRFAAHVVPPLYPVHAFRRSLDSPDPLDRAKEDKEFDGSGSARANPLPSLGLPLKRRLNAGSEIEFIRLAEVGERLSQVSAYRSIEEKESRSGDTIVLEQVETVYTNDNGDTLLRVYKTSINR